MGIIAFQFQDTWLQNLCKILGAGLLWGHLDAYSTVYPHSSFQYVTQVILGTASSESLIVLDQSKTGFSFHEVDTIAYILEKL